MSIPLSETAKAELAHALDQRLVHTRQLFEHTRIAHWNLRGPWFSSRHALFDDLSDHLRSHADQLAERAGALGRPAHVTMDAEDIFQPMPEGFLSGETAIRCVAENLAKHSAKLRETHKLAQQTQDPPTADLLVRVLTQIETDLWTLRSHMPLDGDPVVVEAASKPMPSLSGAVTRAVPLRSPVQANA